MQEWMSYIPDHKSLSEISIPGTHDSATYLLNLPKGDLLALVNGSFVSSLFTITTPFVKQYAQTQTLSIRRQLDAGIRFLDLRVTSTHVKGELTMCHGKVVLHSSLDAMFAFIAEFLEKSPTEVVLVSVKNDGEGNADEVNELLAQAIKRSKIKFYLDWRIPKLGDVRGQAVLINRIGMTHPTRSGWPFGIYIKFPENQSTSILAPQISGERLRIAIQDIYEPETGGRDNKREHVERAYRKFSKEFYHLRFNFISATKIGKRSPDGFAEGLNPKINDMLFEETFTVPWITVMDYVGKYGSGKDEPIAAIVSINPLRGLRSAEGATDANSQLRPGEDLKPGMVLWSSSGAFNLRFQDDGNLVVYRVIDGVPMRASGTHGKGATHVSMQADGNLVVYNGRKALASTQTHGKAENGYLSMRDDGSLVIYNGRQDSVWNSRTHDFKRHF
jgi:hypothetical protein